MSLNPEIEALLALVEAGTARGDRIPFVQLSPEQARADFSASAPAFELPVPSLGDERRLEIPTRDGATIEARLFAEPAGEENRPLLLYFHGGGFVVGNLDTHEGLCRDIATLSGCAVLSVAYRLAPEHPFPTAFEDAVDALAWVGAQGQSLALDSSRLAVGGDSAGGTLAAALSIAARDRVDLPQPSLQILAYPGLSSHQDSESYARFGRGHLLEAETVEWFFTHYLRDESDRLDWRFAPLAAPDLSGLPSAFLLLAECDPLVDEGHLYADRLREAGVPVRVGLYKGMVHEFLRMTALVDEAMKAREDIGKALSHAFNS
jgi:acetyl esterase